MSFPACCKSTSSLAYFAVVANGRIDKVRTELKVVATSSGNAMRRKSSPLSAPRFWKGKTAIVTGAADVFAAAGADVSRHRHSSNPIRTNSTAALKPHIQRFGCMGGVAVTRLVADEAESESRRARARSALISEACW